MTFQDVAAAPRIGLRANWRQFTLLVVVNIFVSAMVGLERAVLPLLAEQDFGIASRTAILSFLVSFGLVKAGTNYFAGRFSDRIGRKPVLILGWLAALTVPVLIHPPVLAGQRRRRLSALAGSRLRLRRHPRWHHRRPVRVRPGDRNGGCPYYRFGVGSCSEDAEDVTPT